MNVLTTRALSFADENGEAREIVLTVFTPFEADKGEWRCSFAFGPPIDRENVDLAGVDFIQSLMICLKIARVSLETSKLSGRVHWQGMLDCGLPSRADEPSSLGAADKPPAEAAAGSMNTLTTRRLGFPDESGIQRELILTVFEPFKAQGDVWKCGITFSPPESAPVRYGVGADYLEALLDSLALARATFEGEVPKGWEPLGDLQDCSDLPYKIGRSFWTDPVPDVPGMPDFSDA